MSNNGNGNADKEKLSIADYQNLQFAVGMQWPNQKFIINADANLNASVVFEDGTSPTKKQLTDAYSEFSTLLEQAEISRQALYDSLAPITIIGKTISALTDGELLSLMRFQSYMNMTVKPSANGSFTELPGVDYAPIVYPVKIVADGIWLKGADNMSVYNEFLNG